MQISLQNTQTSHRRLTLLLCMGVHTISTFSLVPQPQGPHLHPSTIHICATDHLLCCLHISQLERLTCCLNYYTQGDHWRQVVLSQISPCYDVQIQIQPMPSTAPAKGPCHTYPRSPCHERRVWQVAGGLMALQHQRRYTKSDRHSQESILTTLSNLTGSQAIITARPGSALTSPILSGASSGASIVFQKGVS